MNDGLAVGTRRRRPRGRPLGSGLSEVPFTRPDSQKEGFWGGDRQ